MGKWKESTYIKRSKSFTNSNERSRRIQGNHPMTSHIYTNVYLPKQSRLEMLSQRPTLRASWIGYAISNHLLQENDAAYSILSEFRKVRPTPNHNQLESGLI